MILNLGAALSTEPGWNAQYYEWRTLTARLASHTPKTEHFAMISDEIANQILKPFPQSEPSTISVLSDIIHRALELDLEMSKQKALFRFLYFGCPRRFNPDIMHIAGRSERESEDDTEQLDVDLFLAPALCRRGTHDGERFDTEVIILPADVLCSIPQMYRRASNREGPATTGNANAATRINNACHCNN